MSESKAGKGSKNEAACAVRFQALKSRTRGCVGNIWVFPLSFIGQIENVACLDLLA